MTNDPIIKIEQLEKSFGDLHVLKGIDLEVNRGEVVCIIGASGSGKSTLLRCATLLETLDAGTLAYGETVCAREENGRSIYEGKAALRQARRKFGLVFQQFDLFPHYTVLKNVCDAPVCVQKRDRAEVENEAAALLDKMGLKGKENAYPYQLSGGQQQRVAIARALAKNPKLLLCDEATGALDYVTGKQILKLLQDTCREKGVTVVVIPQNSAFTPMADRVIHIKNGTVESMQCNDHPTSVELIEW